MNILFFQKASFCSKFSTIFSNVFKCNKRINSKNKLEVVNGEQIKKNLLLEVIKQEHLTSQLKVKSILMITMVYLGNPKDCSRYRGNSVFPA